MSNSRNEIKKVAREIEAILFVSTEPVKTAELANALSVDHETVEEAIRCIKDHYDLHHGITLINVAGGWQMATASDLSDVVENYNSSYGYKLRLSKAAMEALAIIAYKQPITRTEIEEIRGVRSDKVLETLLSSGLIRVAGRKKGTGLPLLYRTTQEFLEVFGLNSLSELPTEEELMNEGNVT
ncbi:MAG: SMC-Scp complex subunit ScpB [Acetomicrobium sp.]